MENVLVAAGAHTAGAGGAAERGHETDEDWGAQGATPVLFTPVGRKSASSGSPGYAELDQQVRDLAATQNVAMVDLTMLAIADYKMAPDLSALFAKSGEGTHFSELGATEIAGVVSKALKSGPLPLREFIK